VSDKFSLFDSATQNFYNQLDCFWMRPFKWCDFTFDPETFPNPKQFLSNIKSNFGVRVCAWTNSYVAQQSSMFAEGVKGGYFIKRKNGQVWQTNLWQTGLAIVDFTNPEAKKWFEGKLEALLDAGIDCFKTGKFFRTFNTAQPIWMLDFGERIPHLDVVYHDGSDPVKMHNYYTYVRFLIKAVLYDLIAYLTAL
jgi:alpha-D-xyloside xylohydrolase